MGVTVTRISHPGPNWPDAATSGHTAWPGYTGSLTPYSGADVITSGTYQGMHFKSGVAVGTALAPPAGAVFRGCLFEENAPNQAIVTDHGTGTLFEYCTFRPLVSGPPVSFDDSYQFGINHRGVGLVVRRCHFWGFGNAIQLDQSSTAANPVTIEYNYMHDAADQANAEYHHDGILSSNGGPGITHLTIRGNTIVSGGNTNGIALQVAPTGGLYYSDITITGNLVSGWGSTVQLGGDGVGNQRMVFTDNTLSTQIQPVFRELYGWADGNGNLWRRNRWLVPPGAAYGSPADSGKYWTPAGVSATDWTG